MITIDPFSKNNLHIPLQNANSHIGESTIPATLNFIQSEINFNTSLPLT